MKRALITGISGQDGANLSRYLLSLDYEVFGMLRRQSVAENQDARIAGLPIQTFYGDLTDPASLQRILAEVQPHEVYNLAAMSHVAVSFDVPQYTLAVNAVGALNLLEAVRVHNSGVGVAKYYQASSSEMYGGSVDPDGCQRETTPMHPVSPYGISKLAAFHATRHYRRSYGMFAANGILFNHSSPYRGSNFVEAKIAKGVVEIAHGLASRLELGDLDIERDWGHSRDYVRAMHMILQHSTPDDFVIATGVATPLRVIVGYAFARVGLTDWQKYVFSNRKHCRPTELPYLRGDAGKSKEVLGWEPKITVFELIDELIEHWTKVLTKERVA